MTAHGTIAEHTEEKVFRAYTSEQGQHYAAARTAYPQAVYDKVIDFHTSTGGTFATILDVGCGPGVVVRKMAASFDHAIGIDPSPGMIESATILGGSSRSSEPVRFVLSRAETIESVPDHSVDLVTVAAAAHWFDMNSFWPRVAQVIRPGGTVAIWGSGVKIPHPSNPNAVAVTELFKRFSEEDLEPHLINGNRLGKAQYAQLPLPWTIEHPIKEFDTASFQRIIWVPEGDVVQEGEMAVPIENLTMDELEQAANTMSPITRWREAHPELAHTDKDLVTVMKKRMEAVLRAGGACGDELSLKVSSAGVLLLFKRRGQ